MVNTGRGKVDRKRKVGRNKEKDRERKEILYETEN